MGITSLFFLLQLALATTAFPQEKKGFDLSRVSIPLDEIKDGGPPTDDSYHPKEMVVGLEINGKHKAYPFSELTKSGETEIEDVFEGQKLSIHFDPESQSAEIRDADENIIPNVTNFWFAWFAFYPETEVYVPTD